MADREKVINGLESCVINTTKCFFNKNEMCPYASVDVFHCEQELMRDALELLKEQEDLGTELTNAVELIRKKNERIEKLLKKQEAQKFFVDESGKITPLPVVVRCKDCKHYENGGWFTQCFRHNGISPDSNWFCADGERRADT